MTTADLSGDVRPSTVRDSFLGIANRLLRERHLLVWGMLVVPVVMLVVAIVPQREYTSEAVFMPQARRNPSANLSGLAAQFGVSLGAEVSSPVPLYAALMTSRAILGPVAARTFVRTRGVPSMVKGPVEDLLEIKGDDPAIRRELAIIRLERSTRVSPDLKAGIVHVEVDTPDPKLSRDLADAMLGELNRFNLETRQSQATAERKFTERRLTEAKTDLHDAEARLEEFLRGNRDYRNSPQLTFMFQRLERDVTFRQQLYSTFAQAFEQAKVDEVRDTPVITVVQAPEVPVMPKRRYLGVKGLVGVIVGFVLAALFILVRASLAPALDAPDDVRMEAGRLLADLRKDLTRPLRLLRRHTDR